MQIMITITQNNRNPEMLAAVRRDPFSFAWSVPLTRAACGEQIFQFLCQARTFFAADGSGEDRISTYPAAKDGIEKGFRIPRPRARHVVSTQGRSV